MAERTKKAVKKNSAKIPKPVHKEAGAKTSAPRQRKLNVRQKRKVIKTDRVVRSAWRIWLDSLKHLWSNRLLFGVVMVVYIVFYLLFVRGFVGFQLSDVRTSVEGVLGNESSIKTATAMFGALMGTASNVGAQAASAYQLLLFIVFSLVLIWSLRQSYDGRRRVSIGGAFYQSTYPLVQYTLTLLLALVQTIPAFIGVTLYGLVISNGIAVGVIENVLWFLSFVILLSLSIYLLSSTIFATYIVTLKGMTPIRALRSAKKLVRFRRFMIIRKILFLPLILLAITGIVFIPLVFWFSLVAEILFLLYILILLPLCHSYLYTLYRELM